MGGRDFINQGTIIINTENQKSQTSLEEKLPQYQEWISTSDKSIVRRKQNQLNHENRRCYAARKLKSLKTNSEFSTDDIFKNIPESEKGMVGGQSGEGKSIIATSITVKWAKTEKRGDTPDLVIFLSALQKTSKLPLHKLVWGEYAGRIGEDSEEIYQELLERKGKIFVIIDGLGNNPDHDNDSQ